MNKTIHVLDPDSGKRHYICQSMFDGDRIFNIYQDPDLLFLIVSIYKNEDGDWSEIMEGKTLMSMHLGAMIEKHCLQDESF